MSFLLEETSEQKRASPFLINRFLIYEIHCTTISSETDAVILDIHSTDVSSRMGFPVKYGTGALDNQLKISYCVVFLSQNENV